MPSPPKAIIRLRSRLNRRPLERGANVSRFAARYRAKGLPRAHFYEVSFAGWPKHGHGAEFLCDQLAVAKSWPLRFVFLEYSLSSTYTDRTVSSPALRGGRATLLRIAFSVMTGCRGTALR